MQDEAPDGPPEVGTAAQGADADVDAPESTWWPFQQPEPGTEVESDATAGAQAVPDADPTLSFPVEAGPLTEPAPEPRPEVVVEQEQDVPADITAAAPGEPAALAELDPARTTKAALPDEIDAKGLGFVVSLEPKDGPPAERPQGPVLFAGQLLP